MHLKLTSEVSSACHEQLLDVRRQPAEERFSVRRNYLYAKLCDDSCGGCRQVAEPFLGLTLDHQRMEEDVCQGLPMLQNTHQDRIVAKTQHQTAFLDVPVHRHGVLLPIPYLSRPRNISQR